MQIRPTRIDKDAEGGHILQISHKNLLKICNALNREAKHFDALCVDHDDAPASAKFIWGLAAKERRHLTRELLKET